VAELSGPSSPEMSEKSKAKIDAAVRMYKRVEDAKAALVKSNATLSFMVGKLTSAEFREYAIQTIRIDREREERST
jgi:hypothetical protein